ncbi:MAG: GNAT family N-acetyltransferase [Ruminococcaceae bacterium]|jgi:GNAT superfamily N-acetyltransferase|nr:GNAT family N-acetyltransferase [Oscillospiraceae bacterium]
MSKKEIRQIQGAELEEALALVWEVFAEFQAPDFTDEGIEEFWRFIDLEYMTMQVGEGAMTFWGAYEDDYLVGVCAFRGLDHIALLFVDAEYQRRGIGTALVKKAVSDCKKLDPALHRVTVNSSEYGLPFYAALGFEATAGLTEEDGMTFIPMEIEGPIE